MQAPKYLCSKNVTEQTRAPEKPRVQNCHNNRRGALKIHLVENSQITDAGSKISLVQNGHKTNASPRKELCIKSVTKRMKGPIIIIMIMMMGVE